MTALTFSTANETARKLWLVTKEGLSDWQATLDETSRAWVDAAGFTASAGSVLLMPGDNGVDSVDGGQGNYGILHPFHRLCLAQARMRQSNDKVTFFSAQSF